ncbi:amidohydrolase family protein [Lipingzhangella sp. LS1_29]|uniref:Amidohydrolase family protein n=1 Tax=Lipingzhangella rawalii TaxID=2055835 RepID=A0ABU2H2P4_9ACTN|nr:amidohydrolase family protein [Lipingzhangella rawalii]MDS1269566.1 amidohydrolase family protein [Lipingzhangella rawalii]
MRPYTVRSQRVATPQGVVPAVVTICDGQISDVSVIDGHARGLGGEVDLDLQDTALLPGLVDLDVRAGGPASELERTYAELGAAAVRGGVTTVVVAPAPAEPAIVEPAALATHQHAASRSAQVNVWHLGGVAPTSSPADLAELRAGGVLGMYGSLADGGAPDLDCLDDAQLHKAMAETAALDLPFLVHAEDKEECTGGPGPGERPPRAERRGVERVIAGARVTGARVHLTPFTAAECAALLEASRALGLRLSAQTNPHYLCLPAEQIPDGGHALGCRPPLRSNANRQALWSALLEANKPESTRGRSGPTPRTPLPGLSSVGSGHRPATGLHTVEWSLSALWTAARRRGQGLAALERWTARYPAQLIGLGHRTGRIAPGYNADLVAFAPEEHYRVPHDAGSLYATRQLQGRVVGTWVSGQRLYDELSNM